MTLLSEEKFRLDTASAHGIRNNSTQIICMRALYKKGKT